MIKKKWRINKNRKIKRRRKRETDKKSLSNISIESSSSFLLSQQLKLPLSLQKLAFAKKSNRTFQFLASNFFPPNYPPSTFSSLRTTPDIPHSLSIFPNSQHSLTPFFPPPSCVTVKSSLHSPCSFLVAPPSPISSPRFESSRTIPSPTLHSRRPFSL